MAVLACLPGEQHDLGLIAFRLALRARGWRIVYLGSDTPIETIEETSRQLDPSVIVLNAVTDESVRPLVTQLRGLAGRHRLALGDAGAQNGALEANGLLALTGDPIAAAITVTTLVQGGARDDDRPLHRPRPRPGSAPPATPRAIAADLTDAGSSCGALESAAVA